MVWTWTSTIFLSISPLVGVTTTQSGEAVIRHSSLPEGVLDRKKERVNPPSVNVRVSGDDTSATATSPGEPPGNDVGMVVGAGVGFVFILQEVTSRLPTTQSATIAVFLADSLLLHECFNVLLPQTALYFN